MRARQVNFQRGVTMEKINRRLLEFFTDHYKPGISKELGEADSENL